MFHHISIHLLCTRNKSILRFAYIRSYSFSNIAVISVPVSDTLITDTYQIVGVCSSTYFLNGEVGTSNIGDGIGDGYVVIPRNKEGLFKDEQVTVNLF